MLDDLRPLSKPSKKTPLFLGNRTDLLTWPAMVRLGALVVTALAVRVLVCGRAQTPSLDAVLELFDRATVLARLARP